MEGDSRARVEQIRKILEGRPKRHVVHCAARDLLRILDTETARVATLRAVIDGHARRALAAKAGRLRSVAGDLAGDREASSDENRERAKGFEPSTSSLGSEVAAGTVVENAENGAGAEAGAPSTCDGK
jgi:hypothetical protein